MLMVLVNALNRVLQKSLRFSNTSMPKRLPIARVLFKGNSIALSNDVKTMLGNVAAKMKANPTCNININGYPEVSKAAQAVCQKRVEGVKKYPVETLYQRRQDHNQTAKWVVATKNTIDIKFN